jgi:hypothetical protein
MQAVKAAVDYSYDTLNSLIKCLLLFFSTILMTKKSTMDFTKDDAEDIINRRNNGRGPDRGGFGGNQGTSSTILSYCREASDVHGRMRRRLIKFHTGKMQTIRYDVAPANPKWTGASERAARIIPLLCI